MHFSYSPLFLRLFRFAFVCTNEDRKLRRGIRGGDHLQPGETMQAKNTHIGSEKTKHPRIYIIGAGAIGKALAVFLRQESKEVLLIRGSVDNKPPREDMVTVTDHDGRQYQQKITTTTFSNLELIDGVVLIATKTFANPHLANKLQEISGTFSIVLLQNGLNIERAFASYDEVYRCVLFATSQVRGDNQLTFKTVTASPVGTINGSQSKPDTIVNHITTPYFPFRSEWEITRYIWEKTILNCAFNSICPLLEVDNGIFHRNADARELAQTVIGECIALAEQYAIDLDRDDLEEKLLLISKRSDGQRISTYEDIRNNRRTEIDSLNLEMARLADEAGRPELVTRTKLLGEMIRIKSEIRSG